jgi:hypothetical protein
MMCTYGNCCNEATNIANGLCDDCEKWFQVCGICGKKKHIKLLRVQMTGVHSFRYLCKSCPSVCPVITL